ncbi:MAG: YebC/PmpR family DNA-binding transcriptional regulator [bacterium]|nr:YebC/PmpR family DNA-binding transcriptional regulator [bacterium]
MSGHSKWKQIKHQKGAADIKRGQLFSKLLKAITIAAKSDPNPQFNPRLRTTILKAKEGNVPADNIERAIRHASEKSEALEELLLEGYGPGSAAMIVTAITDNSNRTIPELKKIFSDHEAKWASPGSVCWSFTPPTGLPSEAGQRSGLSAQSEFAPDGTEWQAKFPQVISAEDKEKLDALTRALEEHSDVQRVFTNAA